MIDLLVHLIYVVNIRKKGRKRWYRASHTERTARGFGGIIGIYSFLFIFYLSILIDFNFSKYFWVLFIIFLLAMIIPYYLSHQYITRDRLEKINSKFKDKPLSPFTARLIYYFLIIIFIISLSFFYLIIDFIKLFLRY